MSRKIIDQFTRYNESIRNGCTCVTANIYYLYSDNTWVQQRMLTYFKPAEGMLDTYEVKQTGLKVITND